jgi:DNA-binding transcriptional LysR family regulator
MHFSLRQLELFASVARNGSFSRAAEEMHLTQPAVSVQLKNLEDSVGLPLLEYFGRRVHLTDAGRELFALCETVFDSLERFKMTVADMKGLKQGRLRLAVTTTAKYFVPRLLGPFCDRFPGIDVALKVTNRERVLERIANREDDLYIMGQPPEGVDAEAHAFLENQLVVMARSDHPLAGRSRIPLKELEDQPFVMREPGSGSRLAAEQFFAQAGLTVRTRMELGSNEAIKHAVAGGLGVAVLSRHALALEGEGGRVVILDVEGFPIRRHWYVVCPSKRQLSVVAQTFYDYLRTKGEAIVGQDATANPQPATAAEGDPHEAVPLGLPSAA